MHLPLLARVTDSDGEASRISHSLRGALGFRDCLPVFKVGHCSGRWFTMLADGIFVLGESSRRGRS